ncbi:hypothetical protein LP420_02230 [Massilia sp. B-10]|nr:hypothetical protein LP420_02230 [Massilia sp. B-10]
MAALVSDRRGAGQCEREEKTRIWLEEGAKQRERHEEPTRQTIAVHGAIGQHFDKQRIRVTCTDPKGRNRIVNVFTDPVEASSRRAST